MSVPGIALPSDGAKDAYPTILNVAFPYAPIGPEAVGGAEVLCSGLEKFLGKLGFRSIVVAHAASHPLGTLYGTPVPEGPIDDATRSIVERAQQGNINQALAENKVALVHMHGFDFHRYTIPVEIPVLVTLHLPPSWYPDSIWSLPSNFHLVCVSENQRAACPPSAQNRLRVIPNGVELPDASLLRDHGKYVLMLARICPEKNLHTGLDAARLAGVPALLGGAVFPYEAHERYFADEIAPRLTFRDHIHQGRTHHEGAPASSRFLGPVAGEEKARLLSRAACLLLPSLAPETSSLVAMEALAFGVPVIGMAVGAVPEIVEHGRTGFLVHPGENAAQDFAAAIRRLPELDRKQCRASAEIRFPWSRTLQGYAALIHQTSRKETPAPILQPHRTDSRLPGQIAVSEELRIQQITSAETLFALSTEWEDLWRSDPCATPFQHPAWLLPWWKQFGPDGKLHAILIRSMHGGDLRGFLPLYLYQQPGAGTCTLLLVGAGTSDYLDGLWRAGTAKIAQEALAYASANTLGWTEASLNQVRRHSPLALAAADLNLGIGNDEPTSFIDLTGTFPAKISNNIRRYRRIAAARGSLHFDLASTAEESSVFFDELVAFHTKRWESRGEPGVLADPRVLAHHRESLPLLLQAGLLCMFKLRLQGETAGVLYGLLDAPHVHDRRLYLYLIGFASSLAAISPGTLLLDEACRFAAAQGCSKVDLLRGGEDYKQLWGAQRDPTLVLQSRAAKAAKSGEEH